jgi:Rad3-related DNA helicase
MTLRLSDLYDSFPHETPRPVQGGAFDFLFRHPNGALLEIPTGEGKTAIGISVLLASAAQNQTPLYYITPTKTQVEQVHNKHPETVRVFGRAEYPCLYYADRGVNDVTAQASPCYMLDCPHRVDQDTGDTEEPDCDPCPYYQDKFEVIAASS